MRQFTEETFRTFAKAPTDRSWPDRYRGARRLVILCGVATIAQVCAVLATAVTYLFW